MNPRSEGAEMRSTVRAENVRTARAVDTREALTGTPGGS